MDQYDVVEKLREVRVLKKELKHKISEKGYAVYGAFKADNSMGMQKHFDDMQEMKARLRELDKIEVSLIYDLSNQTWLKKAKHKRNSRHK